MDRNELIEAMARAVCCPEGCTGDTGSGNPCNIRSEDRTAILQATAAITAIEAQGLAIVPVEATEHMISVGSADIGGNSVETYSAMIEAGKV